MDSVCCESCIGGCANTSLTTLFVEARWDLSRILIKGPSFLDELKYL